MLDRTGHEHHHRDHSIKSTWYSGLNVIYFNASPHHEFCHVMCRVSCHIIRSVIDARFWDFWPSDILRVCNTLSGPWAVSSGLSGPITWELRFGDFTPERFRDFILCIFRVPASAASGLRREMRPGRQRDAATRAGSGCGNTAHWNSTRVIKNKLLRISFSKMQNEHNAFTWILKPTRCYYRYLYKPKKLNIWCLRDENAGDGE